MEIRNRIEALRSTFKRTGIKAFVVPSSDPHSSEYVAPHWEARKWISGFTGSAGTIVITDKEAGLWTDSRYFLQAASQLEDTGIDLYKEKLPQTPDIATFLSSKLKAGDSIGIDGNVMADKTATELKAKLSTFGILIKDVGDPFDYIWTDRPVVPQNAAFILDIKYAGKETSEKIKDIRQRMKEYKADILLLSALDEIVWALNIRGNDVHCNPVVICYLAITNNEVHLFISKEKVTKDMSLYLKDNDITIHDYTDIKAFISSLTNISVLTDLSQTNYTLASAINPSCAILDHRSPVAFLKAIRNDIEIKNMHSVMIKDGVAMTRFLIWLENAVKSGKVTEISVSEQLYKLRSEQPLFIGESFDTIAGYAEHGAIVHYEATPETNVLIKSRGLLLVDSGAQYLDGTTDITRTIALGDLTENEKENYTLILKGHIALAMAVFPEGTRGSQLDILARLPLWKKKQNYLHGTGHGVGAFLNVHEGPHSIRMEENPVAIQRGMTVTNEPGIYIAEQHGVRTENILLVVSAGTGLFGNYLAFETVTLCPIDKRPIIRELLTKEEIEWLNSYHEKVYNKLSPFLSSEEQLWLKDATAKI